ncbi:MAG: DNA helicase RecQ [Treponema sp.]|jgi:ATP-dependent DNA helicase RecQ|nr:DNA helicase RecQ [Treponema sp.]
MTQDKQEVLKTYFGYTGFRPGQEAVIDAIVSGRDVLAVMPTGAGKSLCYQIPALMLEGLTVVISPLISLMKDQVNALRESGVPAACLNSSLPPGEYGDTVRRASLGEYRILYIAPERLLKEELRRFAETQPIPLVVIDEAHCVSQWGHDFRPSYLQITEFIASLRNRPAAAAFTATATPKVKADILSVLDLRDPYVLSTGFDRRNLYLAVQRPRNKQAALLEFLEARKHKSGIVYCSTRKTVEEIHELLLRRGFAATRYHAGLEDRERHENQDDFLYDRKPVMAATNAFGMGIDKSNVSFVVHYNMPKNIESYYQEAGRAGRDGEDAECVLFYSGQDVRINRFLITSSREAGDGRDEALIQHNLELLKYMTYYAAGTGCLRARILSYFGEAAPNYCGNCSNCRTRFDSVDISLEAQKIISCIYRLKQRGRSFGKTMVVNILRGGGNEKIKTLGLETLSTYGIMADTEARRIRDILEYLIEEGYLAVKAGEYPVVESTGRSGEIVFEKKPLSMMLPRESPPARTPPLEEAAGTADSAEAGFTGGSGAFTAGKSFEPSGSPPVPPQPLDEALLSKLRELRNELARQARLPAYIIFADASLRDMCRKRPLTGEQFLAVFGVGKRKMEQYGGAFTALIREHLSEVPINQSRS